MRTDKSLARRAAAGDTAAFEAIFRRYHQEIYRYCRAIVRSEDDARDALQSTMVAALRSLPGDRREIALKPWLFRVAHNEAISILRAREPVVDPAEAPEGQAVGPDEELGRRERLRRLVADLRELPDRQRSAIVMRELSGLSFGEIAAAQDSSEAAARQALYEARSALADMEEGRSLDCAEVRQAISDGDGRILRGRRLKAHLRSCEGCSAFQSAIDVRSADLHALCTPLPVIAASGVLATVFASHGAGAAAGAGLGTAAAGAGAAGGSSAAAGSGILGGLGSAGALKAVTVVAAVAVGAGAADATGVVKLPLIHSGGGSKTITPAPATTAPSPTVLRRPGFRGVGPAGALAAPGKRVRHARRAERHSDRSSGHGSSPSGRAVGHSGGGAHGSASNASATGLAHSSRGTSSGHSNGGGSAQSHGNSSDNGNSSAANSHPASQSNAGGAPQSQQAPGRTKPAGTPASPPSNGNSGGGTTGTDHSNSNDHSRGNGDH